MNYNRQKMNYIKHKIYWLQPKMNSLYQEFYTQFRFPALFGVYFIYIVCVSQKKDFKSSNLTRIQIRKMIRNNVIESKIWSMNNSWQYQKAKLMRVLTNLMNLYMNPSFLKLKMRIQRKSKFQLNFLQQFRKCRFNNI
jgi:hypothetical protein